MRRGICMRSLFGTICLTLLLALALPCGANARAEAKAIDVLPGAFGESIDMMDDETSERCIEYADRALEALLRDFERFVESSPQKGYLQILQTTLLLPGSLPPDATETDRAIWAELYEGAACVVSFVTIDNSMNVSDVSYAEFSGRFDDYAVLLDGSVKSVSLRGIRSRFFADPVVPGIRVINMGSHYNAVYTAPATAGKSVAARFEYLDDPLLTAFAMNFEADLPVSVSVRHDGEAGGIPRVATDPETIHAVFDALRQITVLGEWSASGHTDDYLNYYFEMADGSMIYGFEFQDGMLLDNELGLHVITGFDGLQLALPDPWL